MFKFFFKKHADTLYAKNQKKEALPWYRRAKEFEKAGDIFIELGEYNDAVQEFIKAKNLIKAGEAAIKAGNNKLAADYFVQTGEYRKAALILAKANCFKESIDVITKHENIEEAAKLLEEVGAKNQAAELYTELKNYDKAIVLYRESKNIEKLIATYRERGDIENAAKECLEKGEPLIAAILYIMNDQYALAGEIYVNLENIEKALECFEKAKDYKSVAKIYLDKGKLDLAAEASEKDSETLNQAAEIYEKLMTFKKEETKTLEFKIQHSDLSSAGKSICMCSTEKALYYTSLDFKIKWKYLFSEDGIPKKTVLSQTGSIIAVCFEGPLSAENHYVFLLNNTKELIWQFKFSEPAKDIKFLPDESGLIIGWGNCVSKYSIKGEELWTKEVDFKVWSVDIAPKSKRIIAGTMGGNIFQFDMDGKEISSTKVGERIHTIRFISDEDLFIVGIGDNKFIMCDLEYSDKWEIEIPDKIRTMEFHYPINHLIISGNNDIYIINTKGNIIYSMHIDERILTFFNDDKLNKTYVALENKTLFIFKIEDCKAKAAECFYKSGNKLKAAEIYRSLGKYQEAYNLFKEVGDFENAANTLTFMGDKLTAARHYEVVGKFKEAAKIYTELGELHSAAKCYGKGMMYIEAAQLFEQLNDYILAGDFYERAGEYKKAGKLFSSMNQLERAVSNYELYWKKHPDDKEVMFELGKYFKEMERYDDAIRMLQQITDDDNLKISTLQKLGQCFQKKQIYDVALDRFYEAIGKDAKPSKDNIDIFYDIGCTYEQKGEFEEAKKTFGKVMAIDYYYKDIQERLRTSESMAILDSKKTGFNPTVMVKTTQKEDKTANLHERYKIISKLGEGGMGVVYLAKDTKLNRNIAWKVLPPNLARDKEKMMQESMLKEAQSAAQISHPNIIAIYDIITTDNECSIIMEYIEGVTLRRILNKEEKLPINQLIRYGIQITDALFVAHQHSVIHRDLKPENIMITKKSDEVKIVDFGLARLGDDIHQSKSGCIVGTIPYMAPEQIMARNIGPHTDIYALGIIFFEMLAGRTPFVGENILVQHLQNTPPNILDFCKDLRGDLADLIYDCLEKDPAKRPVTCEIIREKLKSFA